MLNRVLSGACNATACCARFTSSGWVEPRCTVQSVSGTGTVKLQQGDNSTCFHRLYNWPNCFVDGDTSAGPWTRGRFPTTIENVASNWSYGGQFYYDRVL